MALVRLVCEGAFKPARGGSRYQHAFRSLFGSRWPPFDWQDTEQTACKRLLQVEAGLSITPEGSCSDNLQIAEGALHPDWTTLRLPGAQEKDCIAQAQHWTTPAYIRLDQRTRCTGYNQQGLSGLADRLPAAIVHWPRSLFDGSGGARQPVQKSIALLHRTITGQSRGFQSSSHHASWFWPSQEKNNTPTASPSPDTPPLNDFEPLYESSSEEQAFGSGVDLVTSPAVIDKEGIEGLGEVLEGTDAAAGPWGLWSTLAPMSEAIVVILDGVHSTGLPWWSTIILSVVLMRAALLPLLIVQIKKTAPVGMLAAQVRKASGPDTPYLTLIKRFAAARKVTNTPNPAWFLAMPAVQIPIFVSTMLALRQMAMAGHPGFDNGGILWFTDLTLPAGLGLEAAIFPVAITTLYLTNVQLGFGRSSKTSRFLRIYKRCLQVLAAPAFVGSFYLPQGLLLYWATNNLYSFGQQLAVRNRTVQTALNLPRPPDPKPAASEQEGIPLTEEMVAKMDVNKLVQIAATCQAQGRPGEAIKFLRRALVRTPEEATVHYALGKTHAVLKKWEEAAEYHDQAAGYAKDDDLRGKALYGGGIAKFNQGRVQESVSALRQAAALRPDDLEGQLSLASVLSRDGNKAEALKVVRKAVRLEPKLQKYVEELEKEIRTQADAANRAKGG